MAALSVSSEEPLEAGSYFGGGLLGGGDEEGMRVRKTGRGL